MVIAGGWRCSTTGSGVIFVMMISTERMQPWFAGSSQGRQKKGQLKFRKDVKESGAVLAESQERFRTTREKNLRKAEQVLVPSLFL